MEKKLFLKNADDTEKLGEIISENIENRIVIALKGDLGAGKTTITKSIVENLGIDDDVTSPTFNIMNIYENEKIKVFHFDFYRLESENELENIGFFEYSKMGVVIIEWADKFEDFLPINYILLELKYSEDKNSRYAFFSSETKKYEKTIEKIVDKFLSEVGDK